MRRSTGTVTSAGVIPHRPNLHGFVMPVKLHPKQPGKDPAPVVRGGTFVYALPGGGEWPAQ